MVVRMVTSSASTPSGTKMTVPVLNSAVDSAVR
jgi:hypothetical protein